MSGTTVGTARTIAMLIAQARTMLQDLQAVPSYRYLDQELIDNINGAMIDARRMRPDLFLSFGLRVPLPVFGIADIAAGTLFPIDESCFVAFVYYVVGRAEMREDTFADNSRAVTLMNKFTSQMMAAAA